MIFIDLYGRKKKFKNITKHLVDWDKDCRSKIQKRVKDLLYPYWGADIVFEELPLIGSRMTLDFFNANKRIALEVDGDQHYKYNSFFHGGERRKFLEQLQRDDKKEDFCQINNIKLVRILQSDKLDKDLLVKLNLI
jgi:hypothetical protein